MELLQQPSRYRRFPSAAAAAPRYRPGIDSLHQKQRRSRASDPGAGQTHKHALTRFRGLHEDYLILATRQRGAQCKSSVNAVDEAPCGARPTP